MPGYQFDEAFFPSYTQLRAGNFIRFIGIHHWGIDGQTHQGIVDFFERGLGTSAHEIISAGRVTRGIKAIDTAWALGDFAANTRSYNLELRPEMTAGDFETAAQRIADLWKEWGWKTPLLPHSQFTATACPGRWKNHLARLEKRATEIYQGEEDMDISEIYAWRDSNGRNSVDQGYHAILQNADIQKRLTAMTAQITGLSTAIGQLASSQGLDPVEITKAVTAAVEAGLSDVEFTLKASK